MHVKLCSVHRMGIMRKDIAMFYISNRAIDDISAISDFKLSESSNSEINIYKKNSGFLWLRKSKGDDLVIVFSDIF